MGVQNEEHRKEFVKLGERLDEHRRTLSEYTSAVVTDMDEMMTQAHAELDRKLRSLKSQMDYLTLRNESHQKAVVAGEERFKEHRKELETRLADITRKRVELSELACSVGQVEVKVREELNGLWK